jgi:adenylate cyclase
MTAQVKRRLTTVLCADVEGYTRLMEADEAATLGALRRCRAALATLVERHDGRIVNTWGDAVIAEFASVVEAVQCAVEIQQELSDQDHALPDGQRMRFRIGINLGDVMVEGADVYGDGVNIAARLQELAEPGGIVISGSVYDQVRNKLAIRFDPLGHQQVKNLADPVVSYRITLDDTAPPPPVPSGPAQRAPEPTEPPGPLGRAWNRYVRLPRPFPVFIPIAIFLFLINLFTGFDRVWFHWPVAGMLLFAVLRAVTAHRPP